MQGHVFCRNFEATFSSLTPREQSILACLGQGLSNKEIAGQLTLTESTARSYVVDLMAKTGMNRHMLGIAGFLLYMRDHPVERELVRAAYLGNKN